MSYAEKLKDPRWQKKRLEIFQRDGFKCSLCSHGDYTLHVHHLEYSGEPWDAPDDKLKTVCEHCHLLIEFYKKNNLAVSSIARFKDNAGFIVFSKVVESPEGLFVDTITDGVVYHQYSLHAEDLIKFLKSNYPDNAE